MTFASFPYRVPRPGNFDWRSAEIAALSDQPPLPTDEDVVRGGLLDGARLPQRVVGGLLDGALLPRAPWPTETVLPLLVGEPGGAPDVQPQEAEGAAFPDAFRAMLLGD